jgi:hypothetical protein
MNKRKFHITFRRYTDYNCTIEATSHAKAKMLVAYALLELGGFKKFGDVLKEIEFCRVLEPMKRGRK